MMVNKINNADQVMAVFDTIIRGAIIGLPDHIGKIEIKLDFNSMIPPSVILTRIELEDDGSLKHENGQLCLRTERYRLMVNNDGFVEAVFEGEIPK